MKRAAATPYSLASMQKRANGIGDVQRQLIEVVDRNIYTPKQVCDLGKLLHYFAFDVSSTAPDRAFRPSLNR